MTEEEINENHFLALDDCTPYSQLFATWCEIRNQNFDETATKCAINEILRFAAKLCNSNNIGIALQPCCKLKDFMNHNWQCSGICPVVSCLLKQKISFISIYIVQQQVSQEGDASFKEDKPAGSSSKARGADPADGGLLQGLPGFCFCLFFHPPTIHSGGGEN